LCFTASPRKRAQVRAAAARAGVQVTCIGRITAYRRGVPRLVLHAPDGSLLQPVGAGGFDHFD
jgi:thiamine-monophosphate kinase